MLRLSVLLDIKALQNGICRNADETRKCVNWVLAATRDPESFKATQR